MFQIVGYMRGKGAQDDYIAAQQKPFLVIQLLQIKIEGCHGEGFIDLFMAEMDGRKLFFQYIADQLVSFLVNPLDIFCDSATGSEKQKNQKSRQGTLKEFFHEFSNLK